MSSELGRIEKPPAKQFKIQRKIYLVPLVFVPRQPSPDYAELYERYWRGVRELLLRLEGSLGRVVRLYHEGVGHEGEEGLAAAERLNPKSGAVARGKAEDGASFEALEDPELVAENLDWQRCLRAGLESRKVAELAWTSYTETTRQRYETMASRIDETLKPEEAGLLFVSEEHRIQFPSDVQVFFVAPPALDEIHRWLRDQERRAQAEASKENSTE